MIEKTDFDTRLYAAQKHLSVETAARELRYRWFETIRGKHDAQAIAVAHHRDDSVETMLLNMIRGTGIRGLSGIRPKNGFVVRPLLGVSREEVKQFLKEENLPFVNDSSNLSEEYTRNFIRLRLLPLMEKINPSVRDALGRTAENLADAAEIYSREIEKYKALVTGNTDDGNMYISIERLMRQPAAKTILYELLKPCGFSRSVSGDIFRTLTDAAAVSGKIFEASKSPCKLLRDRDKLIVFKPETKQRDEYKLDEDITDRSNLPLTLSTRKVQVNRSFEINKSASTGTFDYDKLHFPLTLRKWRQGDWFIPFGMNGRQKLSDYFVDHKFNLLEKEETWVLCSGNDILWIIGRRVDNRFRINDKTKTAFIVNFFPENSNN
jgi:tRNA(Ile)-lysidine synthase